MPETSRPTQPKCAQSWRSPEKLRSFNGLEMGRLGGISGQPRRNIARNDENLPWLSLPNWEFALGSLAMRGESRAVVKTRHP
jgi:hypothetical protein